MDEDTNIADFLKKRFPKASEEAVDEIVNKFNKEFVFNLGDCLKYTVDELKSLDFPSNIVKALEESGFIKQFQGISHESIHSFIPPYLFPLIL